MKGKHTGAVAEIKATAWLMEQGYEVFVNASQHGAIDLIARHPESEELVLIDVTTGYYHIKKDGTHSEYDAKGPGWIKRHPGVRHLAVFPDKFVWIN